MSAYLSPSAIPACYRCALPWSRSRKLHVLRSSSLIFCRIASRWWYIALWWYRIMLGLPIARIWRVAIWRWGCVLCIVWRAYGGQSDVTLRWHALCHSGIVCSAVIFFSRWWRILARWWRVLRVLIVARISHRRVRRTVWRFRIRHGRMNGHGYG